MGTRKRTGASASARGGFAVILLALAAVLTMVPAAALADEAVAEKPEVCIGEAVALDEPSAVAYGEGAATQAAASTVATPTQAQIRAFYNAHPFDLADQLSYATEPLLTPPYGAGKLSNVSQTNALNALNFARYAAGIPANVTYNATFDAEASAAALVNAANNNGLSHRPAQPAGMNDALYQTGFQAAQKSNLSMGATPVGAVLLYLSDSDDSNIAVVGHRRWCLNPAMGSAAFGQAGAYGAMYAHDASGSAATYCAVVWPAQTMPTVLFGSDDAWSASVGYGNSGLGTSLGSVESIKVTLKRQSDGKTWTFSQAKSDGYFKIDSQGYPGGPIVIFRPDGVGSYKNGDVFTVAIAGSSSSISYKVTFFDMFPPDQVMIKDRSGESASSITLSEVGERASLYAVMGSSSIAEGTPAYSLMKCRGEGMAAHWSSSDPSVASVEPWGEYSTTWSYVLNGVLVRPDLVVNVVGKKAGVATITCTLANGVSASVKVAVSDANSAVGSDGSVHAGYWVGSGSSWWYAYNGGGYATGWQLIGGSWYHFDGSGWMQTGWQRIGAAWYYLNGDGSMATGWKYVGGVWYYLNEGGDMATGWKLVDGAWYYLYGSGAMATGWQQIGGAWYYLNSGGDMATGWKMVGGTWYYLNAGGDMATGWKQVDGAWYYLYGSGAMAANAWIGNYYVGGSGAMATDCWIGAYHVNGDGLWDQTR